MVQVVTLLLPSGIWLGAESETITAILNLPILHMPLINR